MRQRRRTNLWPSLLLLVTGLVFATAWLYTTWRSSQTVLPSGLAINGMSVGGMTRDQALSAVEQAYTVPVSVTYAGEVVPALLPEIIELRVDMAATAENLDEATDTQTDAEAFLQHLQSRIQGDEPENIEVNAVVLYSRERLNAFLERTAQKYDHGPLQPVALPESGTFRPAAQGTELDIDASIPPLIDAILAADPSERHVTLVVETEPAPEAAISILRDAIAAALETFSGVAGIFTKDLASGQELCMNCEVAFTEAGTLQIGVALEAYRIQELPLDPELATLLEEMLTESDATAANRVLSSVSSTSAYSGAAQVTELLWQLGLTSSYLAVPYETEADPTLAEIATPANSRTDVATAPDPYLQATPMETGLLLEALVQCSRGGGSLRALYPQAIAPAECEEIIASLQRSKNGASVARELPAESRVAHVHGWTGGTHANVAIVYGNRSDFILAVFLYQPEWLSAEESAPLFSRIGELTYRFFNG